MRRLPIVIAFALIALVPSSRADFLREEGATYLEGYFPSPIRLTLIKRAPVFATLAGQRSLGSLPGGQKLEIVAVSDRALRVRGKDRGRGVSGWIGRAFVKEPRPNFFTDLTLAGTRAKKVAALIDARIPATGMTDVELHAALGTPDKHTTSDANGISRDTHVYNRTRRVPRKILRRDAYGQLFQTIAYIDAEIDRTTIAIEDRVVVYVQSTCSSSLRRAPQSVPPPIAF